MATKQEILRELYPEDLFHYADGLTLGEAEVLQETRRLIENIYVQLSTNTGKT